MGKHIDWYLVEVESRLEARLPLERAHIVAREAEDHLHGISQEFIAGGMDAEKAEVAAIERFGTPDWFCREVLMQAYKGYGDPSYRYAPLAVIGVAVGAIALVVGTFTRIEQLLFLMPVLALLFIALLVSMYQYGRFVGLQALVALSLGFAGVAFVTAGRFAGPTFDFLPLSKLSEAQASLSTATQRMEQESEKFRKLQAAFSSSQTPAAAPYKTQEGWLCPKHLRVDGIQFFDTYLVREAKVVYEYQPTLAQARQAWSENRGSASQISSLTDFHKREVRRMGYAASSTLGERMLSYITYNVGWWFLAWISICLANGLLLGIRRLLAARPRHRRNLA